MNLVLGAAATQAICPPGHPIRCLAHVQMRAPTPTPQGYGPADLWSAYGVDPNNAKPATIAIVDAYGYSALESDLAVYRQAFGLPACTKANGCLKIVNQNGQTSPLPPDAPLSDDWTAETALDVQMASAMCPTCKILVVQATDDTGTGLIVANNTAAALGATVISNSWGMQEFTGIAQYESYFNHSGIAIFASTGDNGWDAGGAGPTYPSTSAYVIAVGGTALVQSSNARGWDETAWTSGGSSCSANIARPSWQGQTPCSNRAAADLSAVADPNTGVAVYNARAGGWQIIGGTSAASPIVATLFAATGHGDATPALVAGNAQAFYDVTSGSNGTCGSILCNADVGWDGPTGLGTPNGAVFVGGGGGGQQLTVAITSPADGATVMPGFTVTATASSNATVVGLFIDGTLIQKTQSPPYNFTAPAQLAAGSHLVQVGAIDAANDQAVAQITVTVQAAQPPPPPPNGDMSQMGGGCSSTRPDVGIALYGVLVLLYLRRARRGRPHAA